LCLIQIQYAIIRKKTAIHDCLITDHKRVHQFVLTEKYYWRGFLWQGSFR